MRRARRSPCCPDLLAPDRVAALPRAGSPPACAEIEAQRELRNLIADPFTVLVDGRLVIPTEVARRPRGLPGVSGAPPLVPGRIHGVRLWTVTLGCGSMALCGLNGSGWDDRWRADPRQMQPVTPGATAAGSSGAISPAPDCSCGLYAMHPWPEQTAEVARSLLGGSEPGDSGDGDRRGLGTDRGPRGRDPRRVRASPRPRPLPRILPARLRGDPRGAGPDLPGGGAATSPRRDRWSATAPSAPPGWTRRRSSACCARRRRAEPEPDRIEAEARSADGPKARSKPGSVAKRAVELVLNAVLVILAIAWYGLWAALGVVILGAIFLGWWDDPPPPPPKPAPQLRVLEQRVVRDGARIPLHRDRPQRQPAPGGGRRLPVRRVPRPPRAPPRRARQASPGRAAPDDPARWHRGRLRRDRPAAAARAPAQGAIRRQDGALAPLAVHGRRGADRPAALHHHRPPSLDQGAGPQPGGGGRALRRSSSRSPGRSPSARCPAGPRPRCSTGSLPTPAPGGCRGSRGYPAPDPRAGAGQARPPLGQRRRPGRTRGSIASGP